MFGSDLGPFYHCQLNSPSGKGLPGVTGSLVGECWGTRALESWTFNSLAALGISTSPTWRQNGTKRHLYLDLVAQCTLGHGK